MSWWYESDLPPLGCRDTIQIKAELKEDGSYYTVSYKNGVKFRERHDNVKNMGYARAEEFLRDYPQFEERNSL